MTKPATSEESSAVGLFPFLAVLLCTMGALLVLLVVLAQRVGEQFGQASPAADQEVVLPETVREAAPNPESDRLQAELDELNAYRAKLTELRRQTNEKLDSERQHQAYLEQSNRELEHELARLTVAAKQLEATEADQQVDQQQAEHELARLKEMIAETKAEIEASRRDDKPHKKSYAVVPFKGVHGTQRQRIYLECRKDYLLVQPAGVRIELGDLVDPTWPGNPLLAVLRATQNYEADKLYRATGSRGSDPYPLLLVRPDGIQMYAYARAAIFSTESSFGYEFLGGEGEVTFPEPIDPTLAQVQEHAKINARERLELYTKSAPRKFRRIRGFGETNSPSAGSGQQSGGGLAGGGTAGQGMGNMVAAEFESQGSATSGGGMAEGEYRYGALGDAAGENGTGTKGNFAVDGGTPGSGSAALQDPTSSGNGGTGGEQSVASGGTGNSNPAGASGNQESVEGSSSMSAPSFASTEISQSDQTQAPPPGQKWESGASDSGDAADADLLSATVRSEGVMNQPPPKVVEPQGPGAVPIRRTIHLVVRGDHVALLPSRRARGGLEANGATVSLRQSPADVRQQLVDALRERIEEWGLAGNGLYWKPEVELTAGPEATTAASRVVELLGNTGVELSLPRSAQGGTDRATR